MPKKLQSDDDDLMKIFEHYAELRREHAEYEDNVRTLECDIASLQGRVAPARRTQQTTHRGT